MNLSRLLITPSLSATMEFGVQYDDALSPDPQLSAAIATMSPYDLGDYAYLADNNNCFAPLDAYGYETAATIPLYSASSVASTSDAPSDDAAHLSPTSSSTASSTVCRCIIDLSTPQTLQRDFYAWLRGAETADAKPCSFATPEGYAPGYGHSPPDSHCSTEEPSTSAAATATENPTETKPKAATSRRKKDGVDGRKNRASGRGTNLYGRPYCPGRPLSMDERYRIIQLYQAGMKVNAISKQLCISHGCVSKIITRFRETGLLIPSSHAECRRRKRLQMNAECIR